MKAVGVKGHNIKLDFSEGLPNEIDRKKENWNKLIDDIGTGNTYLIETLAFFFLSHQMLGSHQTCK